jgi:PilZ domain
VSNTEIQERPDGRPQAAAPIEKLIHLALPVRVIHMRDRGKSGPEPACTYDIHPRGARLRSSRDVKVGDLITIERGRGKSVCRVVWTADPDSALSGQFTVQCVEGSRVPWEEELRRMEEQYLPVSPSGPNKTPATNPVRRGEQNRRRGPRFGVEGEVDLAELGGRSRGEGRLEQISECGCVVSARDLPKPGTRLRLVLNMCDISVALRGHVRYAAENRTMGVEFQEIRQGDRPLLDYVLNYLKKPRIEDFADLEVITDHLDPLTR